MRGHINAKFKVEANIHGKEKKFIFFRNKYAFRNYDVEAEEIDAVFNGGSTTIQSYLPYEETVVGILNKLLQDKNIIIANAGIEGKSTYGYLCDFKYWFSKIKNLKPKYYIFYTGYNDTWNTSNSKMMECEGITSRETKFDKFVDYLINSSFFLNNIKKIKHKMFEKKITFEIKSDGEKKFISYDEATKKFKNKKINGELFENYRQNLDNLKRIFKQKNIKPIFITQVTRTGNDYELLYFINKITKSFAQENDYLIIKLDENINLSSEDFYDSVHNNKEGSEKIANFLYEKLNKLF